MGVAGIYEGNSFSFTSNGKAGTAVDSVMFQLTIEIFSAVVLCYSSCRCFETRFVSLEI